MRVLVLLLLLFSIGPAIAWDVGTFKDRMTDRTETYAAVQDGAATLYVGCLNGSVKPVLKFDQSIGWGKIGLSYRFDNGPVVPRFATLSQDGRDLWIWVLDHADAMAHLRSGKRLRISLDGAAMFDFNLSQGEKGLPAIKCGR
ncbi:hypothetical protein BjapCC829_22880 [Bradyrhizobium barranii]|uniref:Uncharacterized protein n=1 Tax=Bradyrhizobium barranii TaxID=2992140 RepID=A0ABY3QAG9_9BRAD|nr:hypothetical protein [Bradyrhizobium japonicum]UFW82837.1 hypothetical protein BjapCC829_22880 [Bradyrhizobium japonicum]